MWLGLEARHSPSEVHALDCLLCAVLSLTDISVLNNVFPVAFSFNLGAELPPGKF